MSVWSRLDLSQLVADGETASVRPTGASHTATRQSLTIFRHAGTASRLD